MNWKSVVETPCQGLLKENMCSISVFEAKNSGQDFVLKTYSKTGKIAGQTASDDLVGQSVLSMTQEDQRNHVLRSFQHVWKTGIPLQLEVSTYQDRISERFPEKFIYRLSNGEIAVIYSDRPEQTVSKNLLKITREFLSLIVNSFEGFIYTISSDFRIKFMTHSLCAHTDHGVTGQNCFKVIHGLDQKCSWCIGEKVLAGNPASFEIQSPKNNRWYYYLSSPNIDAGGEISTQQVIAIDINDRKIAEQKNQLKNKIAKSAILNRDGQDKLLGQSRQMMKVYDLIVDVAASDVSVLICGESGTGKELVAKAIHNLGKRKDKAFLPVNCGGIPENLVESEFFGYKKGAFSGAAMDKAGFLEIADQGTLFLDEVGEISASMQVKLLRSLNGDGYTPLGSNIPIKSDLRLISATNVKMKDLLPTGRMRPDFFYRINVVLIKLPPLRERKDDISLLAEHFLKKYKTGTSPPHIPPGVLRALEEYDWPGNVRELENVIQRYVALNRLDFRELYAAEDHEKNDIAAREKLRNAPSRCLRKLVEEYERKIIIQQLEKNEWQRGKVAENLKICRKTLYKKMKKLGINNDR